MSRRLALLLALVTSLAFGACAGAPAVAPITDPNEILIKSVETLAKAKSVHFAASLTGTFTGDLMGSGQSSEFKLDGTTAEGDLDIAGKKFRATFSVPAFLGLNGEIIQIDQTTYIKTSLTGAKYMKETSADLPVDEVTDPAKAGEGVREFLELPGVEPTKVADATCGDNKDCYMVEISMDSDDIAALASAAPEAEAADLEDASLKVTFGVEKETLRMSKIVLSITAGDQGSADMTLNMTKWDEPVTITEPPADQVTEGGDLLGG
jgi:hypothetical protein